MEKAKNIDAIIREALSEEETNFYESMEEQSMPEMMTGLFKGKLKWLAVMTMVMITVWFGVAIYCVVQFFETDELKSMIGYSAGFIVSMIIILGLKIWNWMQMDKNALLREIKRLELQLSMHKIKNGE